MADFIPSIFRREDGEYFIVTNIHKSGNPKTKYRCTEQIKLIVEQELYALIKSGRSKEILAEIEEKYKLEEPKECVTSAENAAGTE